MEEQTETTQIIGDTTHQRKSPPNDPKEDVLWPHAQTRSLEQVPLLGGSALSQYMSRLPDALKIGLERLSGLSMEDVIVHYNSALPACFQARAYAQGNEIYLGPGQEKHLAHEAWHVVQQRQGRVQATMWVNGVGVSDDPALEWEAEVMGTRAMHTQSTDAPVAASARSREKGMQGDGCASLAPMQRVRGGIEYTEGGTTTLRPFPGGGAPAGTGPAHVATLGATQIGFYNVAPANALAWIGAMRNTDHEVLRSGRVKLSNDVVSAEWVIEGHAAVPEITTMTMMQNMTQDIAALYALRQQLANVVAAQQGLHPADHIVLAPGAIVDLAVPGPHGLFIYRPDALAAGKVQITVQYQNGDTIRRINELNASKYLTGSKIAEGEDAAQVAGSPSLAQLSRDTLGTSSFSTAHTMLSALVAASAPIVTAPGTELTAANVGLIKLMVINDAMASTMTRHAAVMGEAQEKDIQRFFPKAERQSYVNAVAHANVTPAALTALRTQITVASAAMAQLVWNNADPFALRIDETQRDLLAAGTLPAAAQSQTIAQARINNSQGLPIVPGQLTMIKDAVLGANGALLDARIRRAVLAYTDATGVAADHLDGAGLGRVIYPTRGFTPVFGGGQGAIYEFREREVPMAQGNTNAVLATLTTLFNAS